MTLNETLKKPVVKYAAIGAGVYLLYKVVKGFIPSTSLSAAQQAVKKGPTPSYPELQYKIFADSIYQAGMVIGGTDEDTIYNVFASMKNDTDVAKLIIAFGKRRIEFSFMDGTLAEFLTSELDSTEIKQVNKILSSKGINYKF
jgi:hypothetical protein